MTSYPLAAILADQPLLDEIQHRAAADRGFPRSDELNLSPLAVRSLIEPEVATPGGLELPLAEAIVLEFGRPSLLIQNGSFSLPTSDVWKDRLRTYRSKIEAVVNSVGRIELLDHPTHSWVGTGWMVAENVIVTNRHVAQFFAEKRGQTFQFSQNPWGKTIRALVDFREEYRQATTFEASLEKVLFIEDAGGARPDMAFLRLAKTAQLPPPIPLRTGPIDTGRWVGVIGYPARDSRVEQQIPLMDKIFGAIYDVKRFAPGMVTAVDDSLALTHDCSTLGGNSGSVVIDLETGAAVGLHFGGAFLRANYAVKAAVLARALAKLKVQIVVPPLPAPTPAPTGPSAKPGDYTDRQGYRPDFLGSATAQRVPLPTLTANVRADVAEMVAAAQGQPRYVLPYTHFSVVMSETRRLAYYTAANIDAKRRVFLPRVGINWRFDPRLPKQVQIGNELYEGNDLDRGHLVRRQDPIWGEPVEADQANRDTFHNTNSSPQHKEFNQSLWLALEDYILDNADVHDLKVTVFTGPVFREDDRAYRGVKLPRQFWKIVVMLKAEDRKLSATAYMVSQADLLTGLEFVFGGFKTYQVPIRHIEGLTGLKFGKLRNFDPKDKEEAVGLRPLSSLTEIVI